jgi:glycosyltransferase involved in cell wall biosynthesis
MRILMIAPEPFFEPRGTPFSEYHRIRALTDLGHEVVLVTYPFGRDVAMSRLTIHRAWRPPFARRIKVGPSFLKILLDLLLAVKAAQVAARGPYDLVHSHEEGGAIGLVLARMLALPHLYDMHSSLPEQLSNFGSSRSRMVAGMFRWLENRMIARSAAVIVICRHLEEHVRRLHPSARVVLIENAPGSLDNTVAGDPDSVRAEAGIAPDAPLVLYTGTFEAYQGLDLLYRSMRTVRERFPAARLLLVGGQPEQVTRAREDARRSGVGDVTHFAGERPAGEISRYLAAADVLASPRSRGMNTPLKIYQYLRAGRPIVATNLVTHTQVLDPEVAVLTDPTPEAFGEGLVSVLADRALADRLGRNAQHLADTRYTYDAYLAGTRQALDHVRPPQDQAS